MHNPKVIAITGASSGLGAELARAYAAQGITLYLAGRDAKRLESVAKDCKNKGAHVQITVNDVTNGVDIDRWLQEADQKTPVDMVIANAGVSAGTLGGEDVTQVRTLFSTNIDGVINTIHPLIEPMSARRRGQLVIISSIAGLLALPSSPAYCASKAAVTTYGDALRGVLARQGVGVTVVTPGYIQTPMTDVNNYPMPGLKTAQDAAALIRQRLKKNPARIAFPGWFYGFVRFISLLPLPMRMALLNRLPAKPSLNYHEEPCAS